MDNGIPVADFVAQFKCVAQDGDSARIIYHGGDDAGFDIELIQNGQVAVVVVERSEFLRACKAITAKYGDE